MADDKDKIEFYQLSFEDATPRAMGNPCVLVCMKEGLDSPLPNGKVSEYLTYDEVAQLHLWLSRWIARGGT